MKALLSGALALLCAAPSVSSSVTFDGPISSGDTELQFTLAENEAIGTLPLWRIFHNGNEVTHLVNPVLISETAVDADGDGVYEDLTQTYAVDITGYTLLPDDRLRVRTRMATTSGDSVQSDTIRVQP